MKNIFIIAAIIVAVSAVVSGGVFYNQLKQEKAELVSIETRIAEVDEQITQSKEKIANLEEENGSLQQRIAEQENKVNTYHTELSDLKSRKEQLSLDLQNKQQQLSGLKEELKDLINQRNELKAQADEAVLKRKGIDNEIMQLSQVKKELEETIKKSIKPKDAVELEKIVVKMSNTPIGSIVEVNEKYGFAIIDVGSNDGVIVGDILEVYRGDNLIAKAVVEKVFENMSSIVPAEGFTDMQLLVSDKIILAK